MDSLVIRCPKISNYILIAISYALYMKWKPVYALILLSLTFVTYLTALSIEKRRKKYKIICGVTLAILPLLIFKYFNFLSDTINKIIEELGVSAGLPGLNWVMPLGISFFTFQAVGYVVDVYMGRIKAEHNWWDYMLFVCFFPQIASGPISKAKDLIPQIKSCRIFSESQFVDGLRWLLWGMFLKVCVADRLSTVVDSIYDFYQYNSGMSLLTASILYSFQIYSDFAGYSFMAMGVGKTLGFDLINNFNHPYLSLTVTEFWRRWHISLSLWLKDNIYIPLGGNRCGKVRNYFNVFLTFLISGFWHGANWTFVVWGCLHGLFQIIEKMLNLNKKHSKGILSLVRIGLTFSLVNIAWIYFRMPSVDAANSVIVKILTDHTFDIDVIMGNKYLIFPLYILIIKDIVDEYFPSYNVFTCKNIVVRWFSYWLCLMLILLFGVFDAGQFIYVSF